ncbi:ribonuclease domain-containing protein [Kaistella palustris]|uniref:ribonuclease domain-containing protein n=1 Tax=Kaistella palustris TaxID=493376 RepID=UPI0004105586|nr:ribonuclease domain-containing protein [Kaistella palustris]
MNREKIKLFLFFIIGLLTAFLAMYFINTYKVEKKVATDSEVKASHDTVNSAEANTSAFSKNSGNIDGLTAEKAVIDYVKANRHLPDFYITKSEARKKGWIAAKRNLCDVLPGRAIGGDHFSNREKQLPAGAQYFEADVNYRCGNRNADRIVFSRSGDVYLTKNHYKSFQKQ